MGVPDAVLLVGKLAFVLTGASVGFHVVRAAWSEASVGPHALAAVAIVTGCLGLALFPVSLLPDDPGLSIALFLTGEFALHLSLVLLGVFVWQAFRRGSMLGNFLVVANAAALVATAAWECTTQDPFAFDPSMPAAHAAQLSYTFVFGWACLESARAARGAARR